MQFIPSALIFDLDGLLVDSEPIWFEVEGKFLADLGHVWTRERADACMGQGTPNTLGIWKEQFGVNIDVERDTETIIDRMLDRAADMALRKGALNLLEKAKEANCPMAVASSSPKRLISGVLAAKGIDQYFKVVVSGQEVPRSKPAPDVFLRAAELLGISVDMCVVLEDTLAGTRAGIAAGARVLAVPSADAAAVAAIATWVVSDLGGAGEVLGF
ncbi:MAG: HAD family phosphatase [Polyangiaceae bacterium]|nr:HAD family phosphatase [Polyangiaceae bacterium]